MVNTASAGSRTAARYFNSARFLDRPLPASPQALPRPADYLRAAVPLSLWRDKWIGIQARARVGLANLNRKGGRN